MIFIIIKIIIAIIVVVFEALFSCCYASFCLNKFNLMNELEIVVTNRSNVKLQFTSLKNMLNTHNVLVDCKPFSRLIIDFTSIHKSINVFAIIITTTTTITIKHKTLKTTLKISL